MIWSLLYNLLEFANVGGDFQLIPSKDARKRTKNAHPYMQFHFIEKKTKNISWDCHD